MIFRKLQLFKTQYENRLKELRKHKHYDFIEYHRLRMAITQINKLIGFKTKNDIINNKLSNLRG